jgi:glycosyltransferase involved in cell wall biosynthesis
MSVGDNNTIKIYLDNIVFGIQKYGGASTYWMELLKRFVPNTNVFMISQGRDKDIYDVNNTLYNYETTPDKFINETWLPVSLLRYLPLTKALPKRAVYHNSYYRTSFQESVVNIFTVHDFTHKRGYASKFPRNLMHIELTAIGLKNADGIICISENTKKDMLYYYPELSRKNIKVVYHGVNEDFFPIDKVGSLLFKGSIDVSRPYLLFIGKRGGYKKFNVISESMKDIEDLYLVIVGGEELSEEDTEYLNTIMPGRYIRFEGLSNNDLNILYNYAFALVYPSIYEGFGFPIIEAMRAGCPVITTNLSSIPEVAGDAALYLKEVNSKALIDCVNVLRDLKVRELCIEKGFDQSKKFSWGKCAQETFQFYSDTYELKYGL